jgi:2-polyprenyl-6-methoxyphenol hydroxylase-like FAD-dependent oxidoreductase
MGASTDVLIVGAGPTGLTLTAQLAAFGATVRIVDRRRGPARPSRAIVVQPRTLELLRAIGVTPALVARGTTTASARLHLDGRAVTIPMRDEGLRGTPYPFLLVLRQAETEDVLRTHLRDRGLTVEWGTAFRSCRPGRSAVVATLQRDDGTDELVEAGHVVGCDGAGSTVRRDAGIGFAGAAYRQSVVLADVDLDADLSAEPVHAFVSPHGGLVLFAGGEFAPWRVILIRGRRSRASGALDADGLRRRVAALTAGHVAVRDVAWLTDIPQQHRLASTFRAGRVALAGDAAHVHSPAGARGMNTGIQDACNLGWKLGLVAAGVGGEELLDTYDAERRPAARASLLLTHLIFFGEAADHPLLERVRAALAPYVVPVAVRLAWPRRFALRTIGQLGVAYPAGPLAIEGSPTPRHGPRAGSRLRDVPLRRDRPPRRLHDLVVAPRFHLLLCGPAGTWCPHQLTHLRRFHGLVDIHGIGPGSDGPDGGSGISWLPDPDGRVLAELGARPIAQYLIRPDGHVAYRSASDDLGEVARHLARWLPGAGA